MAIQKIRIQNFKCLKGPFEIELNKGLNVLVGNNEAGKSTILEAIHIALTVMYGGRNMQKITAKSRIIRKTKLFSLGEVAQ